MSEITIKNIKYTNVPNKKVGAKVANKLTQSNIGMSQTVAAYLASESFYKLINAIDIDWNGIEIDANTHINDTSDLITWIATKAGQAGADGVTPHIGQNGNWFIGETDTNVKAAGTKGDKGDDGTPGTNGKSAYELYVDGVPSGETAMTQAEWLASLKGAKGDKGDTGTVDTTNFYTKAEVDQKVANAASGGNVDLSGYAQKSELATVATTGDYDDLINKPTIPTVPTKTSDLTNDSGFLTSHQSLSNYYTKDQVDSFNFITEYGLSQLVYGKDESDAKYLTSHQSLANYYTKNDIDEFMFVTGADLSQNVYTKDEVDALVGTPFVANDYYTKNQIDSFNFVNEYGLSQLVYGKEDVYTKNQIDNMGFLTSHQSLANYYDKDDIDGFSFITGSDLSDLVYGKNDVYTKNQIDNMGFITSHQSLSNYYDKDDIDAFHFVTEGNLQSWVYTKNEVNNKIGNLGTVTETVDNEEVTRSKTVKEYVDGNLPNMNNYYTKNDIDGFSFVTGSNLGTLVYGKSDVYTKTEIDNKVGNLGTVTETVDNEEVTRPKTIKEYVDGNTPNMINYYTKTEIDNFNFVTGSNLYQNVYSKTDSDNRYLREHQSLSNYYTKAEADAAIARMQASAGGDNAGGFKIATNSSKNVKGLYNSTANITTTAKNTIGDAAVIEGHYSTASGSSSHAEGYYATASGVYSHAEGCNTTASGYDSHAEGEGTIASGMYSHAGGNGTKATSLAETAIGQYNSNSSYNGSSSTWKDTSGENNMTATLFSVGNGKAENKRHNAFEVDRDGRVYIADTDKVGEPSYILDGTQYYYDYATVPMIGLQAKFASINTSLSNLNTDKTTASQVENIVDTKLGEFQASGGQVQPDWEYNDTYSAFNYIKNKPVGKFKVTLLKELNNIVLKSGTYPYPYYWASSTKTYNSTDSKYYYIISDSNLYLLKDDNNENISEAPSWLDANTRYILDIDGHKVLCNSNNEKSSVVDEIGDFTASCEIKAHEYGYEYVNGDLVELTPHQYLYDIYLQLSKWITQTPNISSLKIYRVDETSNTSIYVTPYDNTHTNFYDKKEINDKLRGADWEEIDPTSTTYINNKPFGEYKVNKINFSASGNYISIDNRFGTSSAGHLQSGTYTLNAMGLAPGDKLLVYANGKYYRTYDVTLKDTSYACTDNYDKGHTSDDSDVEWSFYSYYYGSSRQNYINATWKDVHDKYTNQSDPIKIYFDSYFEFYLINSEGLIKKVVPINNKYLSLASYFADEDVASEYKPFGEYRQEHVSYNIDTLLYNNQSMSFNQTGPSHGGSGMSFTEDWSVGDMITLELDGEVYGTAEVITNASVGNREEAGEGTYDSYNFKSKWMITKSNGSYILAINGMTSGTHSVRVYIGAPSYTYTSETKKLASKYVDYNSYVEDKTILNTEKPFGDYYYYGEEEAFLETTATTPSSSDSSKHIFRPWNGSIASYPTPLQEADILNVYIDDALYTTFTIPAQFNGDTSKGVYIPGNIGSLGSIIIYRATNFGSEWEYEYNTSHKITFKIKHRLVGTKKLDSKYVDTPNLTDYYNKSEVNTLLENAAVGDVDLTSYAKSSDVASTYATKAEVPQIWTGTQEEYDLITNKSETTIYIIK